MFRFFDVILRLEYVKFLLALSNIFQILSKINAFSILCDFSHHYINEIFVSFTITSVLIAVAARPMGLVGLSPTNDS